MIPKITEITVVSTHIPTKTAPMAIKLPPVPMILNIRKLIKRKNISQRNHCLVKLLGMGLFILTFDNIISKKAPLGHRFQHQYLPLKTDKIKNTAIIATTRYPKSG